MLAGTISICSVTTSPIGRRILPPPQGQDFWASARSCTMRTRSSSAGSGRRPAFLRVCSGTVISWVASGADASSASQAPTRPSASLNSGSWYGSAFSELAPNRLWISSRSSSSSFAMRNSFSRRSAFKVTGSSGNSELFEATSSMPTIYPICAKHDCNRRDFSTGPCGIRAPGAASYA